MARINRLTRSALRRPLLALLAAAALLVALQTGGCYYMQAVNGQLEVLRKREPIVDVLEDADIPEETRERLSMVLEARRFAVDEMLLPDNDSYRTYADLERDFVVWNVFAAPEFSLEPKTWCFPVVGCVAYRGYFSEAAAEKHALRLEDQGFDVHVGGVPAYSTLGRFDDPVLNTMMRWSDADLVATLFHELAHQRLFIKGDTGFNESFATAVAEVGLERWLSARGQADLLTRLRRRDNLRGALMETAVSAREELQRIYASTADDEEKRRLKQATLDALSTRAELTARELGFPHAGWLRPPLNNARLASTSLYRGNLPAFRRLFADCRADIDCFYAEADRLSKLSLQDRHAELRQLAGEADPASADVSVPGSR